MSLLLGSSYSTPVPLLGDVTDPLQSDILFGGDLPIVSVRFKTNGDIDEATGDSGSALSYSKVGTWLNEIPPSDNSDLEINFTVDSEDNGDPGTWTGATRGSFLTLDTERTYTWTKDANDIGVANSEVTITLRQVSNTGNSASRSNLSYDAECSA